MEMRKQKKRPSSTVIKEKLHCQRFVNYDGYEVNLDNEESCLKSLQELEKAIGEVLRRLQDITGKKMHQILKLTPYSQSRA